MVVLPLLQVELIAEVKIDDDMACERKGERKRRGKRQARETNRHFWSLLFVEVT